MPLSFKGSFVRIRSSERIEQTRSPSPLKSTDQPVVRRHAKDAIWARLPLFVPCGPALSVLHEVVSFEQTDAFRLTIFCDYEACSGGSPFDGVTSSGSGGEDLHCMSCNGVNSESNTVGDYPEEMWQWAPSLCCASTIALKC